ncbi:MAG: type II toxin-antitoxin system VapC family toxin [Propionibacteriaceae bacterium]|jgi:predicted nucleic-acid-binding protein|nr:type II toxin-antitoxin system VapC family toxin [Propionibacteriaceae bacterium]
MIGIDTNVLVRYVIRDDKAQAHRADSVIDGLTMADPGFITHATLVELWWVLTSTYKKDNQLVAAFIEQLLATPVIAIQDRDIVHAALRLVRANKADFVDALISAVCEAQGCTKVVTLESRVASRAAMTLLVSP